jgi:Tol biopolymer transport system component
MRTQLAMLVSVLAACGNVGTQQQSDASVPFDSAKPDASSICDPTGMFDAPVPLPGVNTASTEGVSRLTADELELYFSVNQVGMDANIYSAQRSTISQAFGAPIALTRVNTAANDYDPDVSNDGLMLLFESNRVSGEGVHLYVSTRTSRVGEFSAPSEVANVNSATVTDNDGQPFVTADGQELWFVSTRAGGLGGNDIYRAVWNGSSFVNVAAITALSSNVDDYLPTLSADKLTIYLSSTRPGGQGSFDIWTAHRSTISDGFPAPTLVPELNSSAAEYVGWLSPDNCRIYFTSDRAGTYDIYIATRHPM